jgi:type IV pilus assembly protein PilC
MPIYKYKALDYRRHSVYGKIVAISEDDAATRITHSGLTPVWLSDISNSLYNRLQLLLVRINNKDLVIFSRQFSLLVSSGVGIVESLTVIESQTDNFKLKHIISAVAHEVDGGSPLSTALQKAGRHSFSDFFVNVIHAGETSGQLSDVLGYLADEMEKDYDLGSKFRNAMIYPIIVMIGMVVVGFVMMLFVMPQLTDILQETGAQLPLSTRIVIWVVDFIKSYLVAILIVMAGIIYGLRLFSKTDFGKTRIDSVKLHLPVFGAIFSYIYLVRFCRSLGMLLKGGVSMTRGLEISGNIGSNRVYQKLVQKAVKVVSEGGSVSSVFLASHDIPKMIPEMMAIGEKTGNLSDVLEKISVFYSRELAAKLNNLSVLLEPLIMVVLAVGVGVLVSAIILPMYNIAGSF